MALDVSAAIAAQMAGRTVRLSLLMHFDFLSQPMRVWPGDYDITSGGHTWLGRPFAMVSVDPGTPSKDGAAEPFSVGVSGVDAAFLTRARAEESDAVGRRLSLYLQFFDEAWQPLDGPISLRRGRMVGFSYAGAGSGTRSLTVRAEGALVARGRPPLTYLSDATQQSRFAGDVGCEFIPSLQHSDVVWPK